LKLETSNFACRLVTGGPIEKMQNEAKRCREGVTWPTFRILGPPPYLGKGCSEKLQIWHAVWSLAVLSQKIQN